ncbi:hypothetical protein J2W54_004728 [Rhodococcus fascians]|uniref:DUF4357 domain-containing protein n=1 Tax=Nocardiaceae TaxID=85025 RepID=UPI0024BAE5CD|nr:MULTISPECIES: DUF4357 domain-containing protein [Rhodococcus]MDJ0427299.1 DUF4357 domain-containing protein [Rhodococcus fascians]MDR6912617.1 hypothetical protein [Rhodococcus sp. 3258]MDR6934314.1 hypothetical protein [Rhodococcus fascians]
MNAPNRGKSIRIFLTDGHPEGMRVVTRPGWTGSLVAFSRSEYSVARLRPEMKMTGIYILMGRLQEGQRHDGLYIGEADVVSSRLDKHHKNKDFWTKGFVLTTQNNHLNKAHVRYLESRLIAIANEAGLVQLENGTSPDPIHLGEEDESDLELFLSEALDLFPLVGVSAFDTVRATAPIVQPDQHTGTAAFKAKPPITPSGQLHVRETTPSETRQTLYIHGNGVHAEGRDDARGFIVFAGSICRSSKGQMGTYEKTRLQLEQDGILRKDSTGQVVLKSTYIFDSPSAAATVICGSSRNGRTEWKTATGLTLRQLQEAEVPISNDRDKYKILGDTHSPVSRPSSTNRPEEQRKTSTVDASSKFQAAIDRSAGTSNQNAARSTPVERTRKHHEEDLKLLIELSIVEAGEEIVYHEKRKDILHRATIESDGAILIGHKRYGALSTALGECVQYSINGWKNWRLARNGALLSDLRDEAKGMQFDFSEFARDKTKTRPDSE